MQKVIDFCPTVLSASAEQNMAIDFEKWWLELHFGSIDLFPEDRSPHLPGAGTNYTVELEVDIYRRESHWG